MVGQNGLDAVAKDHITTAIPNEALGSLASKDFHFFNNVSLTATFVHIVDDMN